MNKVICSQPKDEGKHITIETAGAIAPGEIVWDIGSISPSIASELLTPSIGYKNPNQFEADLTKAA